MGVIEAALLTCALLVIGALFVVQLEPRVLPRRAERGVASPFRVAIDQQPAQPDSRLYAAGPVVALFGVVAATVVLPFGDRPVGADLEIGLFYWIVMVDFVVLGIAMGGFGANVRESVESCYRAIAQLVAYVVPLGLAVLGPAMMARSLRISVIVQAQERASSWYALLQPIGFLLFLVTAAMQSYRPPFLEPFASSIRGGVFAVYGGWKALFLRSALSGLLFVVAAMGAALFLGGPSGPALPGTFWMAVKTFVVFFVMLRIGGRMRPRSTAEMLALSWKVLIPVGLVNVLLVGGLILLGVGQ